jgi:excisionase family DNA binding protein
MNQLPEKELLRPDEVASFLSVAKSTIYSWICTGELEGVKLLGKTIRIRRDEVLRIQKSTLD